MRVEAVKQLIIYVHSTLLNFQHIIVSFHIFVWGLGMRLPLAIRQCCWWYCNDSWKFRESSEWLRNHFSTSVILVHKCTLLETMTIDMPYKEEQISKKWF